MYQHEKGWLDVAAEAQTAAFFYLDAANRTRRIGAPLGLFSPASSRAIAADRLNHMSVHVEVSRGPLPAASVPVGPYVSWTARALRPRGERGDEADAVLVGHGALRTRAELTAALDRLAAASGGESCS